MGIWLLLLAAASLGALYVLIPLRLAALGASGAGIGVTFMLASVTAVAGTRLAGRLGDGGASARPIAALLVLGALLLAAMPLASRPEILAVVVVLTIGAAIVPGSALAALLIAVTADGAGLGVNIVSLLITLCLAGGEVVGGPTGAWLAALTSDAVPFLALAAAALAMLPSVVRRLRTPSPTDG